MAKKKLDIAGSAVGRQLAATVQASERGELDTSKLDGTVSGEPTESPKLPAGVKLNQVKFEHPTGALTSNPLNDEFFKNLPADELARLKDDIRERGILVPIIATADGMILSGHRRWNIAKDLGLKTVPVQFVNGGLTAEQEREFLIKDNVLRRHLTTDEREKLIAALYGDEIDKDLRGGDRKSPEAESKVQSELLIDEPNNGEEAESKVQNELLIDENPEPLAKRVAREMGISESAAKKALAALRKKRQGETPEKTKPEKKAPDPLRTVKAHLGKIVKLLDGVDRETLDNAIIEIVETLEALGIDARYSPQIQQIVKNMRG